MPNLVAGLPQINSFLGLPDSTTEASQQRNNVNDQSGSQSHNQKGKNKSKRATTPKEPLMQPYTQDKAMIDLLDSGGRACTAASDTGTAGNVAAFASVSLQLSKLAVMQAAGTGGDLKASFLDAGEKMKKLAWQTLWLPLATESAIGQAYITGEGLKEGSKQAKTAVSKTEINAILADYTKLAKEKYDTPYDFHAMYVDGTEASLRMLPGGTMVVSSTFLKLADAESNPAKRGIMLRFQIGHEIAHALRRHNTKWEQFRMVDASFKADGMSAMLGNGKTKLGALGQGSLIDIFDTGKYMVDVAKEARNKTCEFFDGVDALHKRQELEADVCSVHMLSELARNNLSYRFSPIDAMNTYQTLKVKIGKLKATDKRQSCTNTQEHPDGPERRDNIAAFYKAVQERKQ